MIYSKSTIKNISESIGVPKLKDGITTALAQDVEYRLHEIITEAMKFMRHSKRTKLTVTDINCALRVRNVEPIYGFETG
ncbi:histone H4-like TAF Taf6, SAGA complex subunit, partial [Coemansia sp. 'formosensis']